DAQVDAAVAEAAGDLPRAKRDAPRLVRDLLRETRRTSGLAADVVDAARRPLRLVGHNAPPPGRHATEVDLGDRQHRVAEDADVHLAAVDVALHENLVPDL